MLDTVDFNHVQHISFTQSLLTDAVSVILSELLSYEHPPKIGGIFLSQNQQQTQRYEQLLVGLFPKQHEQQKEHQQVAGVQIAKVQLL